MDSLLLPLAEQARQFDDGLFPNWSDSDIWDGGFIDGSKLAVGFGKWIFKYRNEHKLTNVDDLFVEYLEWLNEQSSNSSKSK